MQMRFLTKLCASIAALAYLGANVATVPARAQPLPAERPAEQCVAYREMPEGAYRLINECDFAINVSWCSDAAPASGECNRKVGWQSARVETKAEVPGRFVAAQAINIFACRFPKSVEIIIGGSARCQSDAATETPSVLPIMSAASLKNPASIVTASDYPPNARNREGTTRFEMTVGADGRPISCSVTTSSGHADLDSAACKAFLKRARFSPAKDFQGNVVPGRYRGAVTWKEP